MQTKFNIGDEVQNFTNHSFEVRGISVSATNRVDYSGPDGKFFTEELLTLIRPKGCPFKVGDVLTTGEGYLLTIDHFINEGRTVVNKAGLGASVADCKLAVTNECPKTSAQTHVDELRNVLDEICSVLKLHGSPSYSDLPKTIDGYIKGLEHKLKEAEDTYLREAARWQKRNDFLVGELKRVVQTLKGGTDYEGVDLLVLCAHRIAQIDELKKKLAHKEEVEQAVNRLASLCTGEHLSYIPGSSKDWQSGKPVPSNVREALDRLAAAKPDHKP